MKTITVCLTLAFLQVVAGKVEYGRRTIRQLVETSDAEQLQHPPVAIQSSAISTEIDSLSDSQTETLVPNLEPNASVISSSNASGHDQLAISSAPSQTPTAYVTTTSNLPVQIPPNQVSPPTTPFIPHNSIQPSNIPVQIPSPIPLYNPAMFYGQSPPAYPILPFANTMTQQFMYNPYYMQNPMAYTNPQQMMYGMPPNPMPYMPFLPASPIPQAMMNYSSTLNNNLTSGSSPQQLQNTSPFPFPQNYMPAPSTPVESTNPTVISSSGESGTDLSSLPPQVQEFIDMIPQILSMDESTPGQNTHDIKRPTSLRKFPKVTPSSSLKKKQHHQSNYAPMPYSNYPQRYGYYN